MSDYSPEEIKKLIAAPANVGMAVSVAELGPGKITSLVNGKVEKASK